MVWLAQQPDDELRALAQQAADRIGLPLTVVETGHSGLERALADLLKPVGSGDLRFCRSAAAGRHVLLGPAAELVEDRQPAARRRR